MSGSRREALSPWVRGTAWVGGAAMALVTGVVTMVPGAAPRAGSADQGATRTGPALAAQDRPGIPVAERVQVLGAAAMTSGDLAWTTAGDADGLHVLTATAATGYTWRTVATLGDGSVETDRWVGNACLTASGRRLVVAYAPRTATNRAPMLARGARLAVVDLASGTVTPLPGGGTLAYFSPGCGAGEQAVVTQFSDGLLDGPGSTSPTGKAPATSKAPATGTAAAPPSAALTSRGAATRLVTIDAVAGRSLRSQVIAGQVTSAVPDGTGVLGVQGRAVWRWDAAGHGTRLAIADGTVSRLHRDASGALVFLDTTPSSSRVREVTARGLATLATGPVGDIDLSAVPATHGLVITGQHAVPARSLPAGVRAWTVPARAQLSTRGLAAVTRTLTWQDRESAAANPTTARWPEVTTPAPSDAVAISATMASTGRAWTFSVRTPVAPIGSAGPRVAAGPAAGKAATTATGKAAATATGRAAAAAVTAAAAGSSTDPVEAERTCSIPRNDPTQQVYQPTPRQVEWAADEAVQNALTTSRPANWKQSRVSTGWTPQGMFPAPAITSGTTVPAPILLGMLAQESNMWQASSHAVYGVTGNPLVGSYYGNLVWDADPTNDWDVHWDKADCGYGAAQVTDGMVLAGREQQGQVAAMPLDQQRAVAMDYATNIAKGLQMLIQKWNQTRAAGLYVNNGTSNRIENWFYALWAYNSGFHEQGKDVTGAWGLGWTNNPASPYWDPNRGTFLDPATSGGAVDAATPQRWPYPEKVIGFAAQSLGVPAFDWLNASGTVMHVTDPAGFRVASWNPTTGYTAEQNRSRSKPPLLTFCDATDSCQPAASGPGGQCTHTDATGTLDFKCWFHNPATWKPDCASSCGYDFIRFNTTYGEQGDGVAHLPMCTTSGLPAGALIVDDVADSVVPVRANCTRASSNAGTFSFTFAQDVNGLFPSKIDTHQIGGGFNGHFWFTHTRTAGLWGGKLRVAGTWRLSSSYDGAMTVYVAIPDHGAQTPSARYIVRTATGNRTVVVNQSGSTNRWVSLGMFPFDNVPQVTLTSVTPDGDGSQDIAFDAVAFVPAG